MERCLLEGSGSCSARPVPCRVCSTEGAQKACAQHSCCGQRAAVTTPASADRRCRRGYALQRNEHQVQWRTCWHRERRVVEPLAFLRASISSQRMQGVRGAAGCLGRALCQSQAPALPWPG